LVTDLAPPPSLARRGYGVIRRHRVIAAIVSALIVAGAVVDVRLFVVPTSDHARRTDAIVVLGGRTFNSRLDAAIRLARRYPGTPLVVSTPDPRRCPRFVPGVSFTCFQPEPSTTQGEAREAASLAAENGWTSMTVVTTADQIWRARLRFSRCWSGDLQMVQAPTSAWVRLRSVPYEMGATVKAEVFQRSC
jgi:uncharacterized SAM-binding protein YcdF (DUF218 family)